jgi:hypothetical protein
MKFAMKLLPFVSLPFVTLAFVLGAAFGWAPLPRAAADDPEPQPVDCPMCGGNAELHYKRTRYLAEYQGQVVLWRFANSAVWR